MKAPNNRGLTDVIFFRACNWLHVFPRLPPVTVFPRLQLVAHFSALVTGNMFSRASRQLHAISLRVFRLLSVTWFPAFAIGVLSLHGAIMIREGSVHDSLETNVNVVLRSLLHLDTVLTPRTWNMDRNCLPLIFFEDYNVYNKLTLRMYNWSHELDIVRSWEWRSCKQHVNGDESAMCERLKSKRRKMGEYRTRHEPRTTATASQEMNNL